MSEELKPCPFCGSTTVQITERELGEYDEHILLFGYCLDCEAEGPSVFRGSSNDEQEFQEAVAAWNKRV